MVEVSDADVTDGPLEPRRFLQRGWQRGKAEVFGVGFLMVAPMTKDFERNGQETSFMSLFGMISLTKQLNFTATTGKQQTKSNQNKGTPAKPTGECQLVGRNLRYLYNGDENI